MLSTFLTATVLVRTYICTLTRRLWSFWTRTLTQSWRSALDGEKNKGDTNAPLKGRSFQRVAKGVWGRGGYTGGINLARGKMQQQQQHIAHVLRRCGNNISWQAANNYSASSFRGEIEGYAWYGAKRNV